MTHVSNSMKSIGKFFTYMSRSIQEGRQRTANYEIAKLLQQTEYRRESVDTVFNALCNHDLASLRGYPIK
jgi:hypothetical protein